MTAPCPFYSHFFYQKNSKTQKWAESYSTFLSCTHSSRIASTKASSCGIYAVRRRIIWLHITIITLQDRSMYWQLLSCATLIAFSLTLTASCASVYRVLPRATLLYYSRHGVAIQCEKAKARATTLLPSYQQLPGSPSSLAEFNLLRKPGVDRILPLSQDAAPSFNLRARESDDLLIALVEGRFHLSRGFSGPTLSVCRIRCYCRWCCFFFFVSPSHSLFSEIAFFSHSLARRKEDRFYFFCGFRASPFNLLIDVVLFRNSTAW